MTVEELNVKVTADISDLKRDLARMEGAVKGSAKKSEGAMSGAMKKIGGAIAAAFSVQAVIGFSKAVIEVRSEFEKFEAVLTNTLGSAGAAKLALLDIKDMAAKTPFSVAELSGAFVKLTNYGLMPTMEAMRQYGDLASSVGKGFDQLAEAVADATTGEFERLKEFGIKTKKEGNKVTFTFKEQATQVDFTTKAIEEYIKGLGDLEGVSGSMAAISETLGGKVSNLGDKFDSLLNTIGDTSAWGALITAMGDAMSATEDYLKATKEVGFISIMDPFAAYNIQVGAIMAEARERNKALMQAQGTALKQAGVTPVGPLAPGQERVGMQQAGFMFGTLDPTTGLPIVYEKPIKEFTEAVKRAKESLVSIAPRGLPSVVPSGGVADLRGLAPTIQFEETSEAMFDFGSSASILSQSLVAAAHDTENASDIFRNAIGSIVTELTTQLLAAQLGKFAGPIGGLIGGLITLKGRDLETSRTRTQNSVTRYN